MMGAFGRFLELSVPAGDVQRSLGFYRALGFVELPTGEIRRWHYAVVTDGHIAIGLHGDGLGEPALTFVRPNLARQVSVLEEAGRTFECRRLAADEFNEAALRSPEGHLILMLEARTWSPADAGRGCVLGRSTELSLACADVALERVFFEEAGFIAREEDDGLVRLDAPGVTLGLRAAPGAPVATLRFDSRPRDLSDRLAALGLRTTRAAGAQVLTAPEGTRLVID